MEKHLITFKLPYLEDFTFIGMLVGHIYRQTNCKCSVSFNGSKGYLDHIEISCEGNQMHENRISFFGNITKQGKFKAIEVKIYHSDTEGLRIELGKDKKNQLDSFQKKVHEILVKCQTDDNLPF